MRCCAGLDLACEPAMSPDWTWRASWWMLKLPLRALGWTWRGL